jgi:hypothetical protein
MKKILISITLVATTIFTSCSIFVRTPRTSSGVSVGDNTTAPKDSLKTTLAPANK